MDDLLENPTAQLRKRFAKAGNYDESKHPRDERGRWTAGGAARAVGGAALAGGAGIAGLAAMGHPLGRKLLPGVRRAVLGGRYREAATRVRSGSAGDAYGGITLSPQIRRALDRMRAMDAANLPGHERDAVNLIRRSTNTISRAGIRRRTAATGGISRPRLAGTYNPVKPRRS